MFKHHHHVYFQQARLPDVVSMFLSESIMDCFSTLCDQPSPEQVYVFNYRFMILLLIQHFAGYLTCGGWQKIKWNESGFRPPLCTYRLNWARITYWEWWDDWYHTVLQTQDSKLEPWRSEAEHATSRSRRLPTILTFTCGWRRNIFCFFQTTETGNRTTNSGVKGSGANHCLGPPPCRGWQPGFDILIYCKIYLELRILIYGTIFGVT